MGSIAGSKACRTGSGSPPSGSVDRESLCGLSIIPSKQTPEPVYDRTYRPFKQAYPAWEAVAETAVDEVADLIQEAGLAQERVGHRGPPLEPRQRFGKVSLELVRSMRVDEAETLLGVFLARGANPRSAS